MSIRNSYVEHFGEEQASRVEEAAYSHDSGDNPGTDPFKWALLMCIGYECIGRFSDHHGIKPTEQEIKDWCLENADLGSHDGDADGLSMLCGAYDEWIPKTVTA